MQRNNRFQVTLYQELFAGAQYERLKRQIFSRDMLNLLKRQASI